MKETICWNCVVPGTGACPWDKSKGEVPVPGWNATPTKVRMGGGVMADSYIVEACPLYQKIETEGRDYGGAPGCPSKLSEEDLEAWIMLGFTDEEISRRCGLKVSTVYQRRLRYWRKQSEK